MEIPNYLRREKQTRNLALDYALGISIFRTDPDFRSADAKNVSGYKFNPQDDLGSGEEVEICWRTRHSGDRWLYFWFTWGFSYGIYGVVDYGGYWTVFSLYKQL